MDEHYISFFFFKYKLNIRTSLKKIYNSKHYAFCDKPIKMKQTSGVSLKEKLKKINKIENIAWILAGFLRERGLELQWRHAKALGTRWYLGKMVTMKKSIYFLHFWLILIRIRIQKLWSWLLGCGVFSGGIFNFNAHRPCPSSHLRIWKFENVGQ